MSTLNEPSPTARACACIWAEALSSPVSGEEVQAALNDLSSTADDSGPLVPAAQSPSRHGRGETHPNSFERARVRGIAARDRLVERAGMLTETEAAERLGVTPHALAGRRRLGTILAVALPNGEWVYPAVQFDQHGLLPGLGSFLRSFTDADPWTRLAVLLAPSTQHGGRSALEMLEAGMAPEAQAIAATYGEQG